MTRMSFAGLATTRGDGGSTTNRGGGATSNVVDVYVGYLRQKLEAEGQPRLLHTLRGVGYVMRAD